MRYMVSFACVLALASFACGSSTGPSGGTGTLNVRLTDSPFTDAKAVLVTFSEVQAHREDAEWATVPFVPASSTRTCDLKKLQGPFDFLGGGLLTAGHYTQIRLVVSKVTLYFDTATDPMTPACTPDAPVLAGASADVRVPSGEVKLNRGFDLAADGTTTIDLDLDGDRSIIHQTGTGIYIMNPVITIKGVQ